MRLNLLFLTAALACVAAQAAPSDSIMLYGARAAKHNLPELPGAIARGDLQWQPSYFTALALRRTFGALDE